MKIIVAPDSYKDCLPSQEVASVLASALRQRFPDSTVVELPLSDGGEGMAEVLTRALGGRLKAVTVTGPMGKPVRAVFGISGETAFVETAQACGLQWLAPAERNPLITTTVGVGELLMAARRQGCRKFLVGLGGSATCDGGAGMLSVPGIREVLSDVEMDILCDVDTPFLGPAGAARVFGPQKGASPAGVEILEQRMEVQAVRIRQETGVDVSLMPGAGAAGGLGGALAAYFGGRLCPGIDTVLDAVGFEKAIEGSDLIVTGEGKSDSQTLSGKVPFGVLRRSGGIPVALVSGRIDASETLRDAGFGPLIEVSPRDLPFPLLLQPSRARENLRLAASLLADFLIR